MAIAKVEPLITTRSPARAVRLPPARGDGGRRRRLAAGGPVQATADARRRRRASPSGASCRRSGSPSRSRRWRPGAPPELVELGLWVASEYCSTPARGLALVLPPGVGTGAEARGSAPLLEPEVEATAGGPRGRLGGRRGSGCGRGRSLRRAGRGADSSRAASRRPPAADRADAETPRGPRPDRDPGGGAPAPSRTRPGSAPVREGVELTAGQRAALGRWSLASSDGAGPRAPATCSTA